MGKTGERMRQCEDDKIADLRHSIDTMVRDRRARGIPPEGIVLPGEKRDNALYDLGLGLCPEGHPYTHKDGAGRKVCGACRQNALFRHAAIKEAPATETKTLPRRERGPRPGAPYGLCELGHSYAKVFANGQKYCPECKRARRARAVLAKSKIQTWKLARNAIS